MTLPLHEFHQRLGARFTEVNGAEVVADYGAPLIEYRALREAAAVMDLSFRSRVCLLGADRVRFLHGQITNDVKKLRAGEGCYAALVTAKGKMESDLNLFVLPEELLLDFEPGLSQIVTARLTKYIVADDVQVVEVSPHYGLLSVQGPAAANLLRAAGVFTELPAREFASRKIVEAALGEIYLMNTARLGRSGFDLFIPTASLSAMAGQLIAAAKNEGGGACGWTAFETVRVESGIPRYGVDLDATNLPLECGLEPRAVSYTKGCYIGQEVLNRVHSIGHVNRQLCGLWLAAGAACLPTRGDRLFHGGTEAGHITSAVFSPALQTGIALGYLRREFCEVGMELVCLIGTTRVAARVVPQPSIG